MRVCLTEPGECNSSMIPISHPLMCPINYQANYHPHPSAYFHPSRQCLALVIRKVPKWWSCAQSWPRLSTQSLHCNWIFLKYKSELFILLIYSIWFYVVLRINFEFLPQVHIAFHFWFLPHSPASPLEVNESLPLQPHWFTSLSWMHSLPSRSLHWLFLKSPPPNHWPFVAH